MAKPQSTRARRWVQRALSAVAAGMLLLGCARSTRLDREIDRVAGALAEAEAQGARRCAPRELAIAQSRLDFARLEREQGSVADASEHLDVAIENAQAAALLSTPERCPPPRLP